MTKHSIVMVVLSVLSCAGLLAQERKLDCSKGGFQIDRNPTHCEMREQTLPFAGRLNVDGGQNGGVTVKGWARSEMLVRAKVEASAETEAVAKALASNIRLDTSAGQIRAQGPEPGRRQGWAVSYEIFVPHRADLSLKAHNGGIGIEEIQGRVEFDALNGGVSLRHLGGTVTGRTVNGGLSIELAGSRWDGEKLDASTTNGGVKMTLPSNYSARLETGTVNGGINIDFPVNVSGEIGGRRMAIDLGGGGPLVRAVTTNGGVTIKRANP